MAHEYGTRSKSQVDPAHHQLEENIVISINSPRDEITNLKDIVIKKLQENNERLKSRCSNLENKLVSLETLINALEQYRRRKNLVLTGKPVTIADDELESTFISILSNIEVKVESSDIEHKKRSFSGKSFKIYHMKIFHEMFPEFNFNDANRDEGGPLNIINST